MTTRRNVRFYVKSLETLSLFHGFKKPKTGKVDFCAGTGRKAFFDFFSGQILDPSPSSYAFTAKIKGKFTRTDLFSPWHGLFRQSGGDWYWFSFFFSLENDPFFAPLSKTLSAKGTLISAPRASLATCDFSHAIHERWPFLGDSLQNGHFFAYRVGKIACRRG